MAPPSVETDAPEMLIGLALRLVSRCRQRTTWSGLSGLAVVYVSDCVMLGAVSVPVIRFTSAAPYVRDARGDAAVFGQAGTEGIRSGRCAARHLAAGNHDGAGPEVLLLSMPFS